uniref:Beta-fructofuranosidase n=1 Tax=Pisum sativum TaxID=3888 RepID=Q43818_PEA|nr:beta-fructofuranosidase [Pisum sativum]
MANIIRNAIGFNSSTLGLQDWVMYACRWIDNLHVIDLSSPAEGPLSLISVKTWRCKYQLAPMSHEQAVQNKTNDPNGYIYSKGSYSQFLASNLAGSINGNVPWAIAVSLDEINWIVLNFAISRDQPIYINGIVSTSELILDGNLPVITGTAIDENVQVINIAKNRNLSDNYLLDWSKVKGIPLGVINVGTNKFRDSTGAWNPKIGHSLNITGSDLGRGGSAVLYSETEFIKHGKTGVPIDAQTNTVTSEKLDFVLVHAPGITGMWTSVECRSVVGIAKNSLDTSQYNGDLVGSILTSWDKNHETNILVDLVISERSLYGKQVADKSILGLRKNDEALEMIASETPSVRNFVSNGWLEIQLDGNSLVTVERGKNRDGSVLRQLNTASLQCPKFTWSAVHQKSGRQVTSIVTERLIDQARPTALYCWDSQEIGSWRSGLHGVKHVSLDVKSIGSVRVPSTVRIERIYQVDERSALEGQINATELGFCSNEWRVALLYEGLEFKLGVWDETLTSPISIASLPTDESLVGSPQRTIEDLQCSASLKPIVCISEAYRRITHSVRKNWEMLEYLRLCVSEAIVTRSVSNVKIKADQGS